MLILHLLLLNFLLQSIRTLDATLDVTPLTIREKAQYYFSIKLTSNISAKAQIAITFPDPFTSLNSDFTISSMTGVSAFSALRLSTSSLTLTLSNCFPSTDSNRLITITIDNLTNPSVAKTSSSFIINIRDEVNGVLTTVDNLTTGITKTYTAVVMKSAAISLRNKIAAEKAEWELRLTLSYSVPVSGTVEMTMPVWNSYTRTGSYCNDSTTCYYVESNGSLTTQNCSCNSSANKLIVTVGKEISGSVVVLVKDIFNPPSTKEVTGFQISSRFNNGDIEKSNSISVRAESAGYLTVSSIELSTTQINQSSQYKFYLSSTPPISSSSTLTLTLPSDLSFISTQTLTVTGNFSMIRAPSFTLTGNTLLISNPFSSNLSSGSLIIFSVSFILNPSSTQPSGSIYIKIDGIDGTGISETKSTVSVTATSGSIGSITILPDDTTIGSTTIYTFSFTQSDPIPSSGAILITAPSAVTLTNISETKCYLVITGLNPNARCTITNNRNLYIFSAFSSSYTSGILSLKIDSILNPTVSGPASDFTISSYTDNSFQYIISTGRYSVTYTCTAPCVSCEVSATSCTACDANSSFPYLWRNSCNARCDIGSYDPGNSKICVACDGKCKSCEGRGDYCLSCDRNGSYGYLYGNDCLNVCPDNTYTTSEYECKACDSNCKTCRDSPSNCTSCPSTYKLYKGTCLNSCISGTLQQDDTCIDCINNCKDCNLTTSTCTSCPDALVLYNSSCLSACPPDTHVTENRTCIPCDQLCATCAGSTTQCTSCYTGFFLYSQTCVSTCPSGYGRINKVCTQCTGECLECANSPDFCIKCPEGKYRLNGNCVSICPVGDTVVMNDECVKCVDNCKACDKSPDHCTKCKEGGLLYLGSCVDSCPRGFIESEGECVRCQGCKECVNSATSCTACEDGLMLYGSVCVTKCPENFTIQVGNMCLVCERPCLKCEGVVNSCKSCYAGFGLFENACLSECPSGYELVNQICSPIVIPECAPGCTQKMQTDSFCQSECNVKACNFDSGLCAGPETPTPPVDPVTPVNPPDTTLSKQDKNSIQLDSYPLPATTASVTLGIILGIMKLLTNNIILSSSLVSVWSFQEVGSWSLLTYYLSEAENTHGRSLLNTDNSDIYFCFVFSLVLICINICVVNCSFLLLYYKLIYNKDATHKKWVSIHKGMYLLYALMYLVSYKLIWILESNIFFRKDLGAKFTKRRSFYKLLNWYTYMYLIVIGLPGAGLNVFILSTFSSENDVFPIALDCLINFSMEICVIVFQIIYINQVIGREQIIDEFMSIDGTFRSRFDGEETNRSKIHPSATGSISRDILDDRKSIEIIEMPWTPGKSLDDEFVIEELQEFRTETSGFGRKEPESEIENSLRIVEDKQNKTIDQNDVSISFQITENSPKYKSDTEDEGEEESAKDICQFSFMIEDSRPKPVSPKLFDTILNENQLNLSHAKLYDFDPECLEVLHSQSNKRIMIKKSFWDGTVVDSQNKPILTYTPIVPHLYSINKVDESDPHYAILKHKKTQQKIRVRRSFDNSRVVDIENISQGGWVIGKIVISEEDFDFAHAEVDKNDVESVIVKHVKNGCKMKIKKTFIGCPEIHPKTGEVITGKEIKEYNHIDVEIDSQDVHFATIYVQGHPIRVYRSFLGAKILEVLQEEGSSTNSLEVTAQFCEDHTASFGKEFSLEHQKAAPVRLEIFQKIERKLPNERETLLKLKTPPLNPKNESGSVEEISGPILRGPKTLKSVTSSKNLSFKQKSNELIDPMRMRKQNTTKKPEKKRRFFSPFENPQSSGENSGSITQGDLNILNMRRDPEHLELEMLRRGNMS